MRTIGENASRADITLGAGTCDLCGTNWPARKLTRRRDGRWACPQDVHIRDGVTLAQEEAAWMNRQREQAPTNGPPYRTYTNATPDVAFVDWDDVSP